MSFEDVIKNLKAGYLKDLDVRVKSLDEFKGNIDAKSEELRTFFHQLKGSGTTYGLPEVSRVGKDFEEKVKTETFTEEDLESSKKELEEILKKHLS